MNLLKLMLKDERTAFQPGEPLEGGAYWDLEKMPEKIEARLFYYTKGKGSEDVEIVEKKEFEAPDLKESRKFQFKLPFAPYSFSGKLISVIWAIELVAKPLEEIERLEFILSPTGREIDLTQSNSD